MKKLLLKSILEKKLIDIIYINQQGQITKRTIFVKQLKDELVVAFCTLRGQQRTFLLANILAIQKHDLLIKYAPREAESTQMNRFLEN